MSDGMATADETGQAIASVPSRTLRTIRMCRIGLNWVTAFQGPCRGPLQCSAYILNDAIGFPLSMAFLPANESSWLNCVHVYSVPK